MSDPTTRAAWLVQGETELGPQRRCRACRQWWPLDVRFWLSNVATVTHRVGGGRWPSQKLATPVQHRYWLQPCRACQQPRQRLRAARRAALKRARSVT